MGQVTAGNRGPKLPVGPAQHPQTEIESSAIPARALALLQIPLSGARRVYALTERLRCHAFVGADGHAPEACGVHPEAAWPRRPGDGLPGALFVGPWLATLSWRTSQICCEAFLRLCVRLYAPVCHLHAAIRYSKPEH